MSKRGEREAFALRQSGEVKRFEERNHADNDAGYAAPRLPLLGKRRAKALSQPVLVKGSP